MGGKSIEKARFLGLVAELPRTSVFLRMVGPAEDVEAERERFFTLAASVALSTREEAAPDEPPEPRAPRTLSKELSWTTPKGWVEKPSSSSMRLVTLAPEGAKDTQALVTILSTDALSTAAGGIRANVNRWRAEVGQGPLTEAEVAALPHGTVLGARATYVTVEPAAAGGRMVLGAIIGQADRSIFVKMTGPADEVRPEADRFRAFVESLRE